MSGTDTNDSAPPVRGGAVRETDGEHGFPYSVATGSSHEAEARRRDGCEIEAAAYRREDVGFAQWAAGYGRVHHDCQTQVRVRHLVNRLLNLQPGRPAHQLWSMLSAADRLASAAMWLVAHMTYARRVRLDGQPLEASDFKPTPEGHTGGSLNMVPAYVGYLLANALTSTTRSWLMGQGHCVAAIESVNVLTGNLHVEQSARYDDSEQGLSRLCSDFYSYAITPDGEPGAPVGSHVNAHTAGGLIEGGYLGFAELQYVHMPLPGESLVAFLSDGAFEEQRGADWAPRWWRASDSGFVLPIMLLNGRRIEQRSSMAQDGGAEWFSRHLQLNNFDPMLIDGTDPSAFAWAILEAETRLSACARAADAGRLRYPAQLHYTVAQAPKGYGFPGAGTNRAHNLPLEANPALDAAARKTFNDAVALLRVPPDELAASVRALSNHGEPTRPRERDHALAIRNVSYAEGPISSIDAASPGALVSPMHALDKAFMAISEANPGLRVRIGNPDELRSNGMAGTLERFRHRTTSHEPESSEALDGSVITALNEEAVVSAALANKGGLNLVVSYEAFAVKMLGAMRQEMTFARHQAAAGRPPGWLSVPVLLTSHTWENGKNELSHQDTTLSEAWMAEPADRARVLFPPDANAAVECLQSCYRQQGEIWAIVAPKRPVPVVLNQHQSRQLVTEGVLRVAGTGDPAESLLFVAIGAYQLNEVLRASRRLKEKGVAHAVIACVEPGRMRAPRDDMEAGVTLPDAVLDALFPGHSRARVIVSHTRTELLAGVMRRVDTGAASTRLLGFNNRGGTLDTFGMLFANRCTWAHVLDAGASALRVDAASWLSEAEHAAVRGRADPQTLR